MALNSYISSEGGEMGRSQAMQAQAAGIEPSVDMNPVLLKPEAESLSQVVVLGKPWSRKEAAEYYDYREKLWQVVTDSLERLSGSYELLIIEGAGSPAEINLKKHEIVNMRVARHLQAPVLLTGDIDRGGVFASLTGTVNLLEPEEKELVNGFLINRFRGDIGLLTPGLKMLEELPGGRPVVGVIPYLPDLKLAQEDSVHLDTQKSAGSGDQIDIAVIQFPHISNYDDTDALALEEGVRVRFVQSVEELGIPDACILPGTKTTIADLRWMRSRGLDDAVRGLALLGRQVVGICGGYQMLGQRLIDIDGIESPRGSEEEGLGLLPLTTKFHPVKTTRRVMGKILGGPGFFGDLAGRAVSGYEIHMGAGADSSECPALFSLDDGGTDGASARKGKVWGTYLHGVFDTPELRRAWLSSMGRRGDGAGVSLQEVREKEFDRLADHVRKHVDMDRVRHIIGM
jgi:adenosylcobyric acid synthase